jgi:hypothetical protein
MSRYGARVPMKLLHVRSLRYQYRWQKLPAGKYTLWTIPNTGQWTVIFNKKMYGWDVNFSEEALREPEQDALTVDFPVLKLGSVTELFTIKFDQSPIFEMTHAWDDIMVRVPLTW